LDEYLQLVAKNIYGKVNSYTSDLIRHLYMEDVDGHFGKMHNKPHDYTFVTE
jgi:hypothetical protein